MKINKQDLVSNQIKYLDLKQIKINKNGFYIVSKRFSLKLSAIKAIADVFNSTKDEVFIGIDGMAGSGKTTFAKELVTIFDANLVHINDFFLKSVNNENIIENQHATNIDFNKITDEIINKIYLKEDITYQPFDFKTHKHLNYITKSYKRLTIIEGAYSMHPKLFDNYQYKIFFKTSKLTQIKRIIKRSGINKTFIFIKKWIPLENKYHNDLKIKYKSNIIING